MTWGGGDICYISKNKLQLGSTFTCATQTWTISAEPFPFPHDGKWRGSGKSFWRRMTIINKYAFHILHRSAYTFQLARLWRNGAYAIRYACWFHKLVIWTNHARATGAQNQHENPLSVGSDTTRHIVKPQTGWGRREHAADLFDTATSAPFFPVIKGVSRVARPLAAVTRLEFSTVLKKKKRAGITPKRRRVKRWWISGGHHFQLPPLLSVWTCTINQL